MAHAAVGVLELRAAGPGGDQVVAVDRAGGVRLFGVMTVPTRPNGVGVALLGGGGVPCMNHGRTWVRLARLLAGEGVHVLRLDYEGAGESGGAASSVRLSAPAASTAGAAAAYLRASGVRSLVVVGSCFGGHSVLASLASLAADECLDVAAAVLIDLPLCEGVLGQRVEGPGEPLGGALDGLQAVVGRGVAITLLYGEADAGFATLSHPMVAPRLAALRAEGVVVDVGPGALHGLPSRAAQERVIACVRDRAAAVVA